MSFRWYDPLAPKQNIWQKTHCNNSEISEHILRFEWFFIHQNSTFSKLEIENQKFFIILSVYRLVYKGAPVHFDIKHWR